MASVDGSPGSPREGTPSLLNQAPKYGMIIPSRVFVGGIASSTTDADLKQFFSSYGPVRDCKIIQDRAGVSKGYGFVTFEASEDAEKLMKREGDHVQFKDRKLNIGPAIRKQQALPRLYDTSSAVAGLAAAANAAAVLYANGVPYTFHNGLAMFQNPSEAYAAHAMPQIVQAAALGNSAGAGGAVPLMVTPQQYILPAGAAGYYAAAASPGSAVANVSGSGTIAHPGSVQFVTGAPWQWTTAGQPAIGLAMATGGTPLTAGSLPLGANTGTPGSQLQRTGGAIGGGQFIYGLPSLMTHPELVYQQSAQLAASPAQQYSAAGQHYSAAAQHYSAAAQQYSNYEYADAQLLDCCANEAGLMLDPGSTVPTGGIGSNSVPTAVTGAPVQYVQMPYALAAAAIAASMGGNPGGHSQQITPQTHNPVETQHSHHKQQSYGVKRVLAPSMLVSGGTPGGGAVYGMPPIKIIAGQGGQRIVSRTVCASGAVTDFQLIPKSSDA